MFSVLFTIDDGWVNVLTLTLPQPHCYDLSLKKTDIGILEWACARDQFTVWWKQCVMIRRRRRRIYRITVKQFFTVVQVIKEKGVTAILDSKQTIKKQLKWRFMKLLIESLHLQPLITKLSVSIIVYWSAQWLWFHLHLWCNAVRCPKNHSRRPLRKLLMKETWCGVPTLNQAKNKNKTSTSFSVFWVNEYVGVDVSDRTCKILGRVDAEMIQQGAPWLMTLKNPDHCGPALTSVLREHEHQRQHLSPCVTLSRPAIGCLAALVQLTVTCCSRFCLLAEATCSF